MDLAFAVPKDDTEDRAISAVLDTNDCVDPKKLPRPRFAFILAMRSMRSSGRPRKLLVTKRDARHYFHQLRVPRRWQRWLGHPPIRVGKYRRWPLQRSAPMGFGPSAGWPQCVTDATSRAAGLAPGLRVREGAAMPERCKRNRTSPRASKYTDMCTHTNSTTTTEHTHL